jgi:hypothetical protein
VSIWASERAIMAQNEEERTVTSLPQKRDTPSIANAETPSP